MDPFADLEPIFAGTNFGDELMDVSTIPPEVKPVPLPDPHIQEEVKFVSASPHLLQRTAVLLNELTHLLPKDSGINEAVDEIFTDIRVAMHYHYEVGFTNGFRLGSGSPHATKPRVV